MIEKAIDADIPAGPEEAQTQVYNFRALRADGRPEHGTLRASSEAAARSIILDRGWYLIALRHGSYDFSWNFSRAVERDPTTMELSIAFRSLSTFLDAELTVLRALQTLEEIAPPSIASKLPAAIDLVKEGSTLSHAMLKSGWKLPAIVTGLIQAGEGGGRLAPAVERAAQFIEREATVKAALVAALTYPALLLIVGLTSCGILVGIVIPRFATLFADLDKALPASTQFVLMLSSNAREIALPSIVVITLGYFLFKRWVHDADGLQNWHELLAQVPVLGKLRRSAATARLCNALSDLLESGVPIPTAMEYAGRACGDAAMAARLARARAQVIQGGSLSGTVRAEKAMSTLAIGLIKTGEETGRLPAMLAYAGRIEGDRAEQSAKSAARLIEPMLILTFGAVIAFVAAAILQAVYGIRVTA